MKKTTSIRAGLLGSVALLAFPAIAQETVTASPAAEEDALVVDKVVVIGSYLQGVGDSGALPVTVVGRDELDAAGGLSTGELLVNLPSIGDIEFTDNNTGTNGARGDVTGINLRGLGSGRSLVLVNGRRIVGHPQSEAVDSVPVTFTNVNSIPANLIQQVEVLRDGASALYGSDAIAGVVNLSLYDDYEGTMASLRYGESTETSLTEFSASLRHGFEFENGKTHMTIAGTYYERGDVDATEMPEWYSTLDRRAILPTDWLGDTQFDNTSTLGAYGRFQSGVLNPDGTFSGLRVRQGTTNLTSSAGVFHLQPDAFTGSLASLGNGLSIDDGTQDRELRYNFYEDETIIPKVKRVNFATTLTHQLDNGFELFGEGMYYGSQSDTQRAPGPFDAALALIIVPASNYYNPFGPVGSPNRVAGIDAPAEGLDLVIQGYRPLELGPRKIRVEQDLYRLLGGIRGEIDGWQIESALGWSEADARDEEFNRQSKTLLQDQIALSTPDAFNPFGPPGTNPESVLQAIRISSVRSAESTMITWDATATRDDIFTLPGGDVGIALGVDLRREEIFDDSDPRLDGTIRFTNGAIPDDSDLVGVSATNDFGGERDTAAAFMELAIPIVGEANRIPLVHSLDLQVAARFENASDYGDSLKPKVAAHWFLVPSLSVRAAYGEGFRAPNLVQINQGTITRRNQGDADPYRENVTATPNDIGDTYRTSTRFGNADLEAEESESTVFGIVFNPQDTMLDGLRISVDYFRVETTNAITTLGVDRLLDDDFARLTAGQPGNPNVIRAAVTPDDLAAFAAYNLLNPTAPRVAAGEVLNVIDGYVNLDGREVSGYDMSVSYRLPETAIGNLRLGVTATKLDTFEETRDGATFDELRRNGNPEWRGSASATWSLGGWESGWQVRYVSDVIDTSAANDTTGDLWEVDDWYSINGYVSYTFDDGIGPLGGTGLKLGVRNLANELPPYADESPGYLPGLYSVEGRVVYGEITKSF